MNRKALLLLLAGLAASGGRVGTEPLRFRYEAGEKYRLLTEVEEKVYVDGELSHRAEILNKIAVETREVRDGAGLLACTFQTSEKAYGARRSYALAEDYESLFWRDARGLYDIEARYFMPVVRNVPVFPLQELKPGDTWTAPGEEAHDLRRSYGLPEPVHFPIQVQYTYRGAQEGEGKNLEVIDIRYSVFHRLQGGSGQRGAVPVKITGVSEQTYYWDSRRGQPDSYEERFDFIFHLANGQTVEYEGTARGRFLESPRMDKEKVASEIRKELERQSVPDTAVRAEERGVTLSLQNIQFLPNSAELTEGEKSKLRRIGEILTKYADRDLLVSGHTARVGGYTEQEHQSLSESRARAVADFLLGLGKVREEQVITRGFGYRQPLADNGTEEGRRVNRRVEITILEN
jgi:outer membrane protein OmpA-like peptidoglycan-associated protein